MRFRYTIIVFMGACSYGIPSTIAKLAYSHGFSPNEIAGAQVLIAAALLFLSLIMIRSVKIKLKSLFILMLAGSTTGLTTIFYFGSLKHIPASIAIVLLFQFTWMGIIIEAIIEKKWPSKEKWGALFLLASGTALTGQVYKVEIKELSLEGVLLGLCAALTFALFILFSGKIESKVKPILRSAYMTLGATVVVLLIYPPTFLVNGFLFSGLFKWGLLLALFGSVIPIICFAIGVPRIGSGLATILSAFELPVAIIMAYIVLRENINISQWVGVIIILCGIAYPEIVFMKNYRNRNISTIRN
ncbi:DMT family transporter [Bacillus sp. IITD106]|nr:DMT family transporter [Bacillus sp. IITD106]